ncbi:hypothetical protein BOX15_Mlig002496g3, partial [Macrostomum lignano]
LLHRFAKASAVVASSVCPAYSARLPIVQLCRSAALLHQRSRAVATTAAASAMPSALSPGLNLSPAAQADLRRRFLQSQAGLPPLPVPSLEATLDKYMRTLAPIATEEELAEASRLVTDFKQSGMGDKLQQLLLKHAEGKDNWLTDWWVNTAYLGFRESSVINVNPGVRLPRQRFCSRADWLAFCAEAALGLVDFQRLLAEGSLPVERLRNAPLDMSQYYGVLGTCRLAQPVRDAQLVWDGRPSDYMVVAYENQFYRVQLLRPEDAQRGLWEPLPLPDVLAQLVDIVEGHSERRFSIPNGGVGLLSSMHRDRWADAKAQLVAAHPDNASAMRQIERSAFLLCLDRPLLQGQEWARATRAERDAEVCGNMLHGWGFGSGHSANRFFDKTLQLIICEDGAFGFHYEHSPAEGVAAIRIFDNLLDRLASGAASDLDLPDGLPDIPCQLLDFKPYASFNKDLAEADAALQSHIDNLQITCLEFDAYGKLFVKNQCRLSPDAYFQVALQLAYFRLYQQHCATYESGSLRRFRLGRTDTIRSCTVESARFCQLMSQDESHAAAQAFRVACQAHSLLTAQAVAGQGIDRHLLGLRLIAKEHGLPQHPLFDSGAFRRAQHFQLSTSQVPSQTGATMSFGPVVPDGYGVCYNQLDDKFLVSLTAYSDRRGTDSDRLAASLRDSLLDIRDLMLLHSDRPAKL